MRKLQIVTLASTMLLIASCGGASQRIEVGCDQFTIDASQSAAIELRPGEQVELTLCSNPTTGFQWLDPAEISDPAVIEQVSMNFIEPPLKGESKLVGAPGIQNWTFKALAAGSAQVSLSYSQPWEGGEQDAWHYTLTVTVR
ncbi:MAG: protease inhibitor I42 family protein [Anaerolineales bacterium]|jgi:inhibitor of cysteine peptidase